MRRKTENGKRKTLRSSYAHLVCRFPFPVSRRSERGYTLIAVVIGMAVMTILIAAIVPSVATVMKRDREQELIFRGKQYARAISLFQKRYGRYPTQLKEMYENRPRTIRKIWKDPMCNCLDWQVINPNSPDAVVAGGTGTATDRGRPGGLQPTPTPGVFGPSQETKNVGPIIGVKSKVHTQALAEWRGQKFYDQWRFIMGDADRGTPGGDRMPVGFPGYPGGSVTPSRGR